jgi:hypothetical protein
LAEPRSRSPASLTRDESDAMAHSRRGRNLAMLLALLGVCGLFYLITLVRLGQLTP